MQKLEFSILLVILTIEMTLLNALRPPVAKSIIALFGLIAGLALGHKYGLEYPWGAALAGFGMVYFVLPSELFGRARQLRIDWWRRRVSVFPENWRKLPLLVLEDPGPFGP
ncbi:hypothetical protein H6M51_22365 [Rhizobium sp. AQ_MP]|uniref:hypothetical protein n=1 Tax=Rhizobium sp. AQ_MP TaxID=2761536 RepID=UPI00163A0B81|nr:hypothetical protein [Rhizobium sp. AQ_MP]MBC2775613.1 hypothetical protein [Rhizobium sp. AQ_MP]